MAISIPTTAKASRFFTPVAGVVQNGLITTNIFDATVGTYAHATTIYWNSGQLNTQGQQWEAINGADHTDGARNAATPRTNPGDSNNHFMHITEFEFVFTGVQFEILFTATASYDMQVYVEWGGEMWKVQDKPLGGTTPGTMHRRITFANSYHGRIRVHLGGGIFVGIVTEQSSIIKPSPNRLFGICDGDSWADGIGLKQVSGETYWTAGLCDFLFERTGIVWARRAQGGTGYFNNGDGPIGDDTTNGTNSSRFFSASRRAWLTGSGPGASDFDGMPLFYVINGTWNDGSGSGANGSNSGPMAQRALACYQWIRDQDASCTIVQISPEPFNGGGAAGAENGPPTASNAHDLNKTEQQFAIAQISRAKYINTFGPTMPWWTGSGSAGSPASSQQAELLGADGMHPTYHGYNYYAGMIANELGQIRVPESRARRVQ